MGDTDNVECTKTDAGCQTLEESTAIKKHCYRKCTVDCKHDGGTPKPRKRDQCEWIRCAICTHWFHPECVDLPQTETAGVWTCPECRNVSHDVTDLKAAVSTLQETVNILLGIVRKNNASIIQINTNQETTESYNSAMLKDIHRDLVCVKDSVNIEDDCMTDDEDEVSEPTGTLLITDSLGRDIVSTNDDLTVYSEGGANFSTLCKYLKKNKKSYSDMYIVCGTNNCASKRPVDKIKGDFEKLVTEAKKHATNVHIASVLPRKDAKKSEQEAKTLQEKIDIFNQLVAATAQELQLKFINNDNNFKYRDNTCDERLLSCDGLHLSAAGVQRLLENLALNDKAKCKFGSGPTNRWSRDDNKTRPKKTPNDAHAESSGSQAPPVKAKMQNDAILFRGHKSPLSNFFPCNLNVYGEKLHSSEQAYQLRKAIWMKDHENAAKIRSAPTGRQAQIIGNAIATDHTWQEKKKDVMTHILREKLHQCPQYLKALKNSKDRQLIEDTNHKYWARGQDNCGQNVLGKIHELLRSEIGDVDVDSSRSSLYYQDDSYDTDYYGKAAQCWHCGESNHTRKNCRFSYPVECYSCNHSGHKMKFCPLSRY